MRTPLKHVSSLILGLFLLLSCHKENAPQRLLPVFGEKKFVSPPGDTLYHTELPFRLTSQWGSDFTIDSVRGKIHVVDFFFATCRSICPEMSKRMSRLQKKYAKDDSLLFMSITVNPQQDTVEALAAYARLYEAIRGKWYLLTGNRDTIYHLARKSYLINAEEDESAEQGFIHSELFVLLDPEGHIRGFYDGTSDEDVQRLENDLGLLKKELFMMRRKMQPLSEGGR